MSQPHPAAARPRSACAASSCVSNDPNWVWRKSIAAERAEDFGIKRGIALESAIRVYAEVVISVELIEQLIDEPRCAAHPLNLALTA
jgi:hypothetical protein